MKYSDIVSGAMFLSQRENVHRNDIFIEQLTKK